MAVENSMKHSIDLFKNADGSGMIFFMRPCNDRQELKPHIEYGGGRVTSKVLKGSIKLAEKGSLVTSDDYILAKYIEDCLKENKLLDMDQYRVTPGTRVRSHSGNSDNSINSFSSNDSLSPASYIVQTAGRDYKGRSKYSKEDDIAMITFLIEEKRYAEALGIRVWKDMEQRKVTNHSASSMNTRYRKHILPKIDSYKFDVDRRWLSKLTGGSVVKETEPEFSAEALFTTSKKSSRPDTFTTGKSHLNGGFGDVFAFTSSDEKSPRKSREKSEKLKDKTAAHGDNGKTVLETEDNTENMEDKQKQINELDVKVRSPSDIFEISEDDVGLEENVSANESINEVVEMDDGRLKISQESADENLEDVDFEVPAQEMLEGDGKKLDILDTGTSNSEKVVPNSVDQINEETCIGEEVVRCNSNGSENAETQPPQLDDICSNEVTSSGQCENACNSDQNRIQESPSPDDEDSFDEMLQSYIEKGKVIDLDGTDKIVEYVIDSNDKMDADKTVSERLSNSETVSRHCDKKQESKKRKRGSENTEVSSTREEKKRKLVAECEATCQRVANTYDISQGFVRQLLYQCSGDVDRTVSYVKYGPHSPDLPPWTDTDDDVLSTNRKSGGLIRKFGLADVIYRYNFINYIT